MLSLHILSGPLEPSTTLQAEGAKNPKLTVSNLCWVSIACGIKFNLLRLMYKVFHNGTLIYT